MHSGVLKITTQGSSQFHAIFAMMACIACQYNFLVFSIGLDLDGFFIGDIQVESPRVGENVKTYNISLDPC